MVGFTMANPNDVGVSLVEEEEDLLEYDNSMSSSGEQQQASSTRQTTGGNSEDNMRIVSDSEVRQAAEELLKGKLPQVFIEYNNHEFLLFRCEGKNKLDINLPVMCDDNSGFSHGCNVLFSLLRKFLEESHGKLSLVSKELMLEIPCLDLTLCEDNVYNNQISFSDITTIFDILSQRSQENSEVNIPEFIRGIVHTRPRFVSRYNTLVELIQSSATLKNIKPFQNDETHPLVLDDNSFPTDTQQPKEVVVLNLEGGEGNFDMTNKQDTSDSEELLEIVDEDNETSL